MRTVIIGDSLTEGIPGVSYWRFLKNKSQLINRGLGGDTLIGASRRVEKMLADSKYNNVDKYILEIGANDVLLPYLRNHSVFWRMIVKIKASIMGSIPCDDIHMFREKYEQLICKLLDHDKSIGIIGLPIIECNIHKADDYMKRYDIVVKELAVEYCLNYIDLRTLEVEIKGDNKGSYFFGKTNLGTMLDTILTSVFPFSDVISKSRGLAVTIDSVHLNRKTAKQLAIKVNEKLLT
jgi:lysophospholipase L1-like esterase